MKLKEYTVFDHTSEAALTAKALPTSGWVRDYVDLFHPCSEAPKLFHIVCGLSCLSAAAGRRKYIQVGGMRIYTNLFIALIGGQGITRKSTAANNAQGIITDAFGDLLYAGDATPEALKQKILKDSPERILYVDELANVLGGPEYAKHIRQLLAILFDCPARLEWARMGMMRSRRRPAACHHGLTTQGGA